MQTECPLCGEEIDAEIWTNGECPTCHNGYCWDEQCDEDYNECWAEVCWDRYA